MVSTPIARKDKLRVQVKDVKRYIKIDDAQVLRHALSKENEN